MVSSFFVLAVICNLWLLVANWCNVHVKIFACFVLFCSNCCPQNRPQNHSAAVLRLTHAALVSHWNVLFFARLHGGHFIHLAPGGRRMLGGRMAQHHFAIKKSAPFGPLLPPPLLAPHRCKTTHQYLAGLCYYMCGRHFFNRDLWVWHLCTSINCTVEEDVPGRK